MVANKMVESNSINRYNISVRTVDDLEIRNMAKLIFTVKGTLQQTSNIKASDIDSRLPDFYLYKYQKSVFDILMSEDVNLLLVSGTGSGNTEACILPLLCQLRKNIIGQILAVYPTNVLAHQQQQRIEEYAKNFNLKVEYWSGDTIKFNPTPTAEIITTNPNFLLYNFKTKSRLQKFENIFEKLNTIIFDEIHMYDSRQVALLSSLLKIIIPKKIIFLSATVGNLQEVAHVMTSINNKVTKYFSGSSQKSTTQYIILPNLSNNAIETLLVRYLKETGMTIVFTQSIIEAESLKQGVKNKAFNLSSFNLIPADKREQILNNIIAVHHSNLSNSERELIEEKLKKGITLVFSPKTLAQGIDVGNVIRIIHKGLPNSLADFLQREGRAGRRKETNWTESIIIPQNSYDDLILTNKETFELYIKGSPERILLIPNSPVSLLFNSLYKIKLKPKELTDIDIKILDHFKLIEIEPGKNKYLLNSYGKIVWNEELSFYGSSRQINFLNSNGELNNTKDRVSTKELYLKYQPNTIHYRYNCLQRVSKYTGKGKFVDIEFEKVEDKVIKRLYKNNNLRSYTVTKMILPKDYQNKKFGIARIAIKPVNVVLSYLKNNSFPQIYETLKTYPAVNHKFFVLTTFVKIKISGQAINMELAVHCLIQALRIIQDIKYTEIEHTLIKSYDERLEMLLYETNFSGLLLHLNINILLKSAEEIAKDWLNKYPEQLYPLPTCKYIKKLSDNIEKRMVLESFKNINETFNQIPK